MVVLELLHVAVELDEARLLGDPHVARDVPGDPVPGRPPAEPAPVPGEVVEHVAHLPDVHGVEGEVVEVRVAEVDERHHVVVRVDVEPDARLAEPVREPHPEHLGVEADARLDVAGEAVDVAEPARARPGGRCVEGRACWGQRSASVAGARYGITCTRAAVGVVDEERAVALLPRHAERLEVRARVVERAAAGELEGEVVVARARRPRRARGSTARRCRRAAPGRPPATRSTSAELELPPRRRLVEVGDPQADVVEPVQPDHGTRPSATIRSASSSGIASATWSVCAETCICSPGPGEVDVPLLDRVRRAGRCRRSRPRRRRPAASAASSPACR